MMRDLLAGVLFVSLLTCLYAVAMSMGKWFDATREDRALAEDLPESVEETRHRHELLWMGVLMNMSAVVAGALAGIGGSLVVEDGVDRLLSSLNGLQLVLYGVIVVEMVGVFGIIRLRRPWHSWIVDAGQLHEFLRQGRGRSDPRASDVAIAERKLRQLRAKHLRSRRVRVLRALGLQRPLAAGEWRTSTGSAVFDAAAVGRSFDRSDVLRYSLVRGYSVVYLLAALSAVLSVCLWHLTAPGQQSVTRLGALIFVLSLLWPLTLMPARRRLILETRKLARQRVWLAEGRRALHKLSSDAVQRTATDQVVVQIGSWVLLRRR